MSHLDTFITQLMLLGFVHEPVKSDQMTIMRMGRKSVYIHYYNPEGDIYVNTSWNTSNVFSDLDKAWENICKEVCA